MATDFSHFRILMWLSVVRGDFRAAQMTSTRDATIELLPRVCWSLDS